MDWSAEWGQEKGKKKQPGRQYRERSTGRASVSVTNHLWRFPVPDPDDRDKWSASVRYLAETLVNFELKHGEPLSYLRHIGCPRQERITLSMRWYKCSIFSMPLLFIYKDGLLSNRTFVQQRRIRCRKKGSRTDNYLFTSPLTIPVSHSFRYIVLFMLILAYRRQQMCFWLNPVPWPLQVIGSEGMEEMYAASPEISSPSWRVVGANM